MKTLTEIAIVCGARIVDKWERYLFDGDEIVFDDEAELQAFVDAVNAERGEAVAVVGDASYYDGKVSRYKPNGNLVIEHGLDYRTDDVTALPIGTKLYTAHQPVSPDQSDFDEWMKNNYTKVLMDSIKNDYVPKSNQSAYIKRLEDATGAIIELDNIKSLLGDIINYSHKAYFVVSNATEAINNVRTLTKKICEISLASKGEQ